MNRELDNFVIARVSLLNVFSRKEIGFDRQANHLELNFSIRKQFSLDGQTREANVLVHSWSIAQHLHCQ